MQIVLERMHFYAYHGFFEQERIIGNDFYVTATIDLQEVTALQSDNLNDTLNYQQVYDVVKDEMQKTSKLLEAVAQRIVTRLKTIHPKVTHVRVQLSKKNPPLGGQIDAVTLVVEE
jgi:dihydroneopterin aldolase